jgi:hypothetical protein
MRVCLAQPTEVVRRPIGARRTALARMVVAIGAALVVWLVATPAFAAAPQCDTRGAITFAPPPALQPPEQSIDVIEPGPTCIERFVSNEGYEQGNLPVPTSAPEPVLPAATPVVAPAAPAQVLDFPPPEGDARPGVRARLDRPPRA